MRSPRPSTFRLTFVLPRGSRAVKSGVFTNWVKDCELSIAAPFIAIIGPSKERVMDQAARLLRVACHGLDQVAIGAVLESPPPVPGSDGWTIIVHADIAFAPTSLGAVFPEITDASPAHLVR